MTEGRSLGQIPGAETHQRPAPAGSSAAESGPEGNREGFGTRLPSGGAGSFRADGVGCCIAASLLH